METIACSLTQTDQATRQERWVALGDRALRAVETTDTGLRLAFTRTPAVESELDELAELERICCAFADWTLETHDGLVALSIDGRSPESITAVQSMFRALRHS